MAADVVLIRSDGDQDIFVSLKDRNWNWLQMKVGPGSQKPLSQA